MDVAIKDERLYYNTMPYSIYEAKIAQEKLNQEKLHKFQQHIFNVMKPLNLNSPLSRSKYTKKKLSDQERGYQLEKIPKVGQRSYSIAANQVELNRLQYFQEDK